MVEERRIVVDDLHYSDLRPYRIPLLRRLAESDRLAVRVWHGAPGTGLGAPTSIPDLPVPERRVENMFWPGPSKRVMWQRGALRILSSESDVVVCSEVVHNLTIWILALSHRVFGKSLVLHGYFYRPVDTGRVQGLRSLARRLLHRLADAYIAYGERGRASLISQHRAQDRVFVSQNTLDTERLAEISRCVSDEVVSSLRDEMSLGTGPVLLYVGRLVPEKRVEVAIQALELMEDPASLVVVGDGYLRPQLETMARHLPVHFRGATYDDVELAPYFKLADVLVLPGRVGLNCVHGFANGVPCVTTSEDVVEQSPEYEYLEHDYNSLILPTDHPRSYAHSFQELLRQPATLKRLQRGAIETAGRLTMERMAAEYERAVLRAAAG